MVHPVLFLCPADGGLAVIPLGLCGGSGLLGLQSEGVMVGMGSSGSWRNKGKQKQDQRRQAGFASVYHSLAILLPCAGPPGQCQK